MRTYTTYILGFGLSLVLTFVAFGLVWQHVLTNHVFPSHEMLQPALVVLAILQLLVQLVLFLHVGQEEKPWWRLMALLFALLVVVILVGGTLWIMHNLEAGHASALGEPFINGEVTPQSEK